MKLKKGFTLIELLIVITIIGMLIAILVPAVLAALETANKMRCAANLQQIGRAYHVYLTTYGGKGPDTFDKDVTKSTAWDDIGATRTDQEPDTINQPVDIPANYVNSNTANMWSLVAKGFCDEIAIFICPSAGYALEDVLVEGIEPSVRDFKGPSFVTYSYQNQYGTYRTKRSSKSALAIAADANPQRDDFDTSAGDLTVDYLATVPAPKFAREEWATVTLGGSFEANSPNHKFQGQNVLFADGHVSWSDHPYVGVRWDNIWTQHKTVATVLDPDDVTTVDDFQDTTRYGTVNSEVLNENDTYLVP